MVDAMLYRLVPACLFLAALTTGSVIKFNASQPSIQPPLTEDLSMRCSLEDTETHAGPTSGPAVIGKRDTSRTSDDVAYVTSLIIKKDGADIATINEHFPAKSLTNSANLKVSGSLSGTTGEKGFLELSWHRPDLHQVGDYTCEVTSLMTSGSTVKFTATVAVDRDELGLDDIINHVSALQIHEETNRKLIEDLQNKVDNQQATILAQNAAFNSLKTNTSSQITGILKTITERTHMETGLVQFPKSASWIAQPGNQWLKREKITFKRPFSSPPQIITSVGRMDMDLAPGKVFFFKADDINVTNNGFTLETWTDHDYLNQIYYIHVYWMAVPHFQ